MRLNRIFSRASMAGMHTICPACAANPEDSRHSATVREFHIHPNRSLSGSGAAFSVLVIGLSMVTVSGYFASLGGWFVLPFAGAELVLLAWAVHRVQRAARVRERVLFGDGRARVLVDRPGAGETLVWDTPLAWTRVRLWRDPRGWYPSRLLLRHAGREIEIGRCLIEEERESLANVLCELSTEGGERPLP